MHKLLVFVLLTYSIAPITHACVLKKWNVFVTNDISNDIIARIKSGDDNLGDHTIPPEGNYNWSFCDRIFGHTIFYGYFSWGSKFQSLALFDTHIRELCRLPTSGDQHCYWSLRADGFYVSSYPDQGWVFIKPWN